MAPLVMLAVAGAAAFPAQVAPRAMLAEAGAAAIPALVALLAVRTLLNYAPLYWVQHRGGGRFCRNCCSCLRHGA